MIDLTKQSGIPIKLDKNKQIIFSSGVNQVEVDVRTYRQIKDVLMQPFGASKKTKFYFMYRNLCLKKDQAHIADNGLRYDITVIPGIKIGKEFNKTAGHFHSILPNTNLTSSEVYEVLYGEAIFLFQKKDTTDFIYIKAKPGDKVVVPPNYAHVTINPGNKVLVAANWGVTFPNSLYGAIKKKKGLMWYYTVDGWVKNKNYKKTVKPREAKPEFVREFDLARKPMYFSELAKLDFLKNPQNYTEIFAKLYK